VVRGPAGPVLAVAGVVATDPAAGVQVGGLVPALAGFAVTLAGQTGMGASWGSGWIRTSVLALAALVSATTGALGRGAESVPGARRGVRPLRRRHRPLPARHRPTAWPYRCWTHRRLTDRQLRAALGSDAPARHDDRMFALPAVFAALPGLRRCGCCGGVYPGRRVRALASTPGVVICRGCAHAAAAHAGGRRR
jgi:hypothetical protein